jgi:hypothetical protein
LVPELQACNFDHRFLFVCMVGVRSSRRGAGFHSPVGAPFMIVGAGGGGQVGVGSALTACHVLIRSSVQG